MTVTGKASTDCERGVFLLLNSHKNYFSTERFVSIIIALIIRQNVVFSD